MQVPALLFLDGLLLLQVLLCWRPEEMRRIAELSFKPTGVKTIDENCGKIAKLHETIAIESNNLYDLVEIIADKSGTTTMAKEKIKASLQKQYEEWSKLLKAKSVKSTLQDLPSLALGKITDLTNNLDSTISATLNAHSLNFRSSKSCCQHLEKMGEELLPWQHHARTHDRVVSSCMMLPWLTVRSVLSIVLMTPVCNSLVCLRKLSIVV